MLLRRHLGKVVEVEHDAAVLLVAGGGDEVLDFGVLLELLP